MFFMFNRIYSHEGTLTKPYSYTLKWKIMLNKK
jgi:hypothetical protein